MSAVAMTRMITVTRDELMGFAMLNPSYGVTYLSKPQRGS
jgi:hypothetical protein